MVAALRACFWGMQVIARDVEAAAALGADGVVLGLLTADGGVDIEHLQPLVRLCHSKVRGATLSFPSWRLLLAPKRLPCLQRRYDGLTPMFLWLRTEKLCFWSQLTSYLQACGRAWT